MGEAQGASVGRKVAGWFGAAIALMGIIPLVVTGCQAMFTPKQFAATQAEADAKFEDEQAAETAEARAAREAGEAEKAARAAEEARAEFEYNSAMQSLEMAKRDLRDPAGAIFRDVWAVRATLDGKEMMAVCGVVNAKNGFGGYTGDTMFFSLASLWTPDMPGFEENFRNICINGEKVMRIARP